MSIGLGVHGGDGTDQRQRRVHETLERHPKRAWIVDPTARWQTRADSSQRHLRTRGIAPYNRYIRHNSGWYLAKFLLREKISSLLLRSVGFHAGVEFTL